MGVFLGIGSGGSFVSDLEKNNALALWYPHMGGIEGDYQRRMRAAGYGCIHMTARGLGDMARFLSEDRTIRPAHLGKNAVYTQTFPPIIQTALQTLTPKQKGLLLWLIEGHVLASQELSYLVKLADQEKRLKVVVEVGYGKKVRWEPLRDWVTTLASR
jgi:NAD(P)H-quinone oxidoreductase subunit N